MALFEEYKNNIDQIAMERANNWAIAIGLQRVDERNVSEFLIQVTRQEIEGKVTMNEAQAMIDMSITHRRIPIVLLMKLSHLIRRRAKE